MRRKRDQIRASPTEQGRNPPIQFVVCLDEIENCLRGRGQPAMSDDSLLHQHPAALTEAQPENLTEIQIEHGGLIQISSFWHQTIAAFERVT